MLLRSRLSRSSMVLLILVSQILTTTGIPLPIPMAANAKDRSRPFPCMDRPCGCMSAEQCRRECCCFSRQEKEAWAAAHNAPVREVVPDQGDSDTSDCPQCKQSGDGVKPESGHHSDSPWVIGLAALQCHSCGPLGLLAVTPAVVVSCAVAVTNILEPGELILVVDKPATSLSQPPLDPPPRRS